MIEPKMLTQSVNALSDQRVQVGHDNRNYIHIEKNPAEKSPADFLHCGEASHHLSFPNRSLYCDRTHTQCPHTPINPNIPNQTP
ncbi:MAG: hypothetical protein J5534_08325 [Fibrobacter sp.]|nr:hypothetical protein [Fibrobacter sp.]